jgi:hypothetical protein
MKTGPLEERACWFAASDAEVEDAGYSPWVVSRSKDFAMSPQTSYPKPDNPSAYSHHPKHPFYGEPIGSSRKNASEYNHKSRQDNSELAPKVVTRQANNYLAKNLAD